MNAFVFFKIALIKSVYTQFIFLPFFSTTQCCLGRRLTRSLHKTIYLFISPFLTSYPWGLPGPGLGGFHITLISEEEMANACTSEGGSLGSAFKSRTLQISQQITHKTHHQSYFYTFQQHLLCVNSQSEESKRMLMVSCEALWSWGRIPLRETLCDWEVTETQNIHHISSSHSKRHSHGYHKISLTQCDHTLKLFDPLDHFCVGSESFFFWKVKKFSKILLFS